LKPFSLIFVTIEDDSPLKIADFTMAKKLTPHNHPNMPPKATKILSMFGTVEFLAPEMIECTYATTATDAWSIGIIAFMLVSYFCKIVLSKRGLESD
jgi:serine/threonine protein kinase